MSFARVKRFCERNSTLLTGGGCFFFCGLALIEKWLNPVISSDGAGYLEMEEIWRETGHYDAVPAAIPDSDWIPAFPLFLIKCLADCGISPEVAGVGISMVIGCTLPLLVYLMAQEIQSDKRISLAASMLMAFNPSMIELACEIQRDMLYIGLCGWAVFFGLKGLMQKKLWPWIPAGMLGALSALTRYETFEMFPVLLVAFLIFGLKKIIPWKRICQQVIIFAVALSITAVGMVYLMGIQEHIVSAYSKYFNGKAVLLEQNIYSSEKK